MFGDISCPYLFATTPYFCSKFGACNFGKTIKRMSYKQQKLRRYGSETQSHKMQENSPKVYQNQNCLKDFNMKRSSKGT